MSRYSEMALFRNPVASPDKVFGVFDVILQKIAYF